MKTVIFVLPSLEVGGAEKVVANIIGNLDNSQFRIILALGKKEGMYLSIIPDYVKIVELSGSRKASKSFLSLLKLIYVEKPQLVFSTLGMISVSALCSFFVSKKVRFISRFGNTISADLVRVKRDSVTKYMLQKIYYKIVIWRSELIAQSSYMKDDLISTFKLNGKPINVVYNPCFRSLEDTVLNTDKLEEAISFYAIGRFDWQKGYDILIDAFDKLHSNNPKVHLYFIGDGKLRSDIEAKAASLECQNNIHFLGYKPDPFSLLDNKSVLVSSSRFEGFSNVIVEALSLGIPVVATDCPSGNSEIIQHEINGYLVPFDDDIKNNLSHYMSIMIENFDGFDMALQSKLIKDKFSVDKAISQYEFIFSKGN